MPTISMSYATWMAETKRGVFTPRSSKLKELDAAFEKFELAKTKSNLDRLRVALRAWMNSKGTTWKQSTRNKTGTVEALYEELFPDENTPPKPGEVRFAPSFGHASELNRVDAERAMKDARELVLAAWPSIAIPPSVGSDARARYEAWFGSFSGPRHAAVRKNLDKIQSALVDRPIKLYYRGDRLPSHTLDDEAGKVGTIRSENFFGAAYPVQPPRLDQNYTHLFLGKAFFSACSLYQNDSMGGVMIHELSHAICQTNDVIYKGVTTYGEVLCDRLAKERPDLAITNADCYEYYCEGFQFKRFQVVRPALNLPPKASITL